MSRRTFCIFCAITAAIIGLILALGPVHVIAEAAPEKGASTARFSDAGETKFRVIEGTVAALGSNEALKNFRLLALAKLDDNTNLTADLTSSDKGAYRVELGKRVVQLRVYAYGDFVIPDGWSTVPLSTFKFEKTETWDLRVRPNVPVVLKGRVTIAGSKGPAGLGNVYLAPLDVRQDGSVHVFDAPSQVRADEDGAYQFEVPSGYYRLWAVWADRSVREWPHYIGIESRVELFADKEMNVVVKLGPQVEGKVTDARDGTGVPGRIDLYTNAFLKQLNNTTADGDLPDEEDENGKSIIWPAGTFKFRVYNIDTEDFAAVVRPRSNQSVLRVITGLKMSELEGKKLDWKLFTEDQITLDLRIQTADKKLPLFNLDVSLEASRLDDPKMSHLRSVFQFSGATDENGWVRFMGLAPGKYSVYCEQGSVLLGEISVTARNRQSVALDYSIPFAVGKVSFPDGTPCTSAMCLINIDAPQRGKLGPYFWDCFRNKLLRDQGLAMLPLNIHGATFKLQFFANESGKAIPEDWTPSDFPLKTPEVTFAISAEKAYEFDLKLDPVAGVVAKSGTGPMKNGEFWYRMEDQSGLACGYTRMQVESTPSGGQSVAWEMKVSFTGGEYKEDRFFEVDSKGRLVKAAYSAGDKPVSDAIRSDGKLVGKARGKDGNMAEVNVDLPDDATSYMCFLLAATLPQEKGAAWKGRELDEANSFADTGEVHIVCTGKDTLDWEGKALNCWRYELAKPQNERRKLTIWVSGAREIVKVSWGSTTQILSRTSTKELFRPIPPAMMETAGSTKEWLELECVIEGTTPEKLYDYFTKPELLVHWWPPEAEIEMKVGGKYRAIWKSQNQILEGTVTDFDPGKKFVFTWRWNETPKDAATLEVQVLFEKAEKGAKLTIRHGPNGIDEKGQEARKGYAAGWQPFVAKLKVAVK